MVSFSFVIVCQVVPLSLRLGAPLWVQSKGKSWREGKSWRGLKDCRSFSFREFEPDKKQNFSFLPYCYIGPIERKQWANIS